jgi:hypothetical protein
MEISGLVPGIFIVYGVIFTKCKNVVLCWADKLGEYPMPHAGIVAFAFGVPANTRINTRIAQITETYAGRFGLPIFTQRDLTLDAGFDITRVEEQESPASTLAIARGAVAWARIRQAETLWVIAALPHLWRCQRDLRIAGEEAQYGIVQRVPREIVSSEYMSWFDPTSTQKRVRSFQQWIVRESILHVLPFSLYAKVAK